MRAPSWLLLAWSGLAATLVWLGIRAILAPSPRTERMNFTDTARDLGLGLIVLPAAYGIVFEALGRADLATGAILGGLHAAAEAWLRTRAVQAPRAAAAARHGAAAMAYGLCIGFLYLVPG